MHLSMQVDLFCNYLSMQVDLVQLPSFICAPIAFRVALLLKAPGLYNLFVDS